MDLGLEIPGSPLDAVMSHEVWEEYYNRLTELIGAAPHDARLRQHAAHGRARRASPERAARRGRGDGASRQPVEGEAARRRDAAERRAAAGARRDRVARARHRHRARRSRLPDRIAASDRHAAPARRALGPHGLRHAEGPGLPDLARRPDRVRGAAARGPPRRARSHRLARRAARRARAADRRRDGVPRLRRGRAVRAVHARVALSRPGAIELRRRASR